MRAIAPEIKNRKIDYQNSLKLVKGKKNYRQ